VKRKLGKEVAAAENCAKMALQKSLGASESSGCTEKIVHTIILFEYLTKQLDPGNKIDDYNN